MAEHRQNEESDENSDHGFRGSMYGAIGIASFEGGDHSLEHGVSTQQQKDSQASSEQTYRKQDRQQEQSKQTEQ